MTLLIDKPVTSTYPLPSEKRSLRPDPYLKRETLTLRSYPKTRIMTRTRPIHVLVKMRENTRDSVPISRLQRVVAKTPSTHIYRSVPTRLSSFLQAMLRLQCMLLVSRKLPNRCTVYLTPSVLMACSLTESTLFPALVIKNRRPSLSLLWKVMV